MGVVYTAVMPRDEPFSNNLLKMKHLIKMVLLFFEAKGNRIFSIFLKKYMAMY